MPSLRLGLIVTAAALCLMSSGLLSCARLGSGLADKDYTAEREIDEGHVGAGRRNRARRDPR